MVKQRKYKETVKQIKALVEDENEIIANLANISAILKQNFDSFSWCGFYIRKGKKLVLGPFQGKPACMKIEIGKGLCGKCAAEKRSIIAPDVSKFPGYISCDSKTRSEIVIPIIKKRKVKGVLDIDSRKLNAFNKDDEKYLTRLAALISKIW